MNTKLGCMCQPTLGAWGQTTESVSPYLDLAANLYKQLQERPALERVQRYEAELRLMIEQGGTAKKIADVRARLDQARRDLAIENEKLGEIREYSDLGKLGLLTAYGIGAAVILFILAKAVK